MSHYYPQSNDFDNYIKPKNFTILPFQLNIHEPPCEFSCLLSMKYLKAKADSFKKDSTKFDKANILKINNQQLRCYSICKINNLHFSANISTFLVLTFDTLGQTEFHLLNVGSNSNLISMFCIFKEDYLNRKYLFLTNLGNSVDIVIFTESIEPNCVKNNPVYLFKSDDKQDIFILERNYKKQIFSFVLIKMEN